jgi:hypothetical protein
VGSGFGREGVVAEIGLASSDGLPPDNGRTIAEALPPVIGAEYCRITMPALAVLGSISPDSTNKTVNTLLNRDEVLNRR